MVMLDIYYAENWSLGLDLRIMLRTVPQVLFGEGRVLMRFHGALERPSPR